MPKTTADTGASPDPVTEPVAEVVVDPAAEPGAEAVTTDAKPAGSSAADEKDAKAAMLAVLTDAVKPVAPAPEDSSPEGTKDPTAEAKAEAEPDKKGDAEAEAEVPFHDHPRWKQVLAERDGYKPDAVRARNIDAFMAENGLKAEEVAEGYMVMAQLKSGDPALLRKALTYFETHADELRAALGETLPDDLQAKVDDKLIDLEDAQEMAKARADAKLRDAADVRRDERTEAEKSAEVTRKLVADVGDALTKWEDGVKAKDPDYAKKAEMVEKEAKLIWLTEGAPKTVAEAVDIADRAYAYANSNVVRFTPAKKQIDTTTPRSSSAAAEAAPKTMLEAVQAGLERAAR